MLFVYKLHYRITTWWDRYVARRRKNLYARRGSATVGAREDHHGTRQRYTIMTSVHSWEPADAEEPPRCAVLFKGDGERALADACACVVFWGIFMQSFCGCLFRVPAFPHHHLCIMSYSHYIVQCGHVCCDCQVFWPGWKDLRG